IERNGGSTDGVVGRSAVTNAAPRCEDPEVVRQTGREIAESDLPMGVVSNAVIFRRIDEKAVTERVIRITGDNARSGIRTRRVLECESVRNGRANAGCGAGAVDEISYVRAVRVV